MYLPWVTMAVSSATIPWEPVSNACSTSGETTSLSPYTGNQLISLPLYKERTHAALAFARVDSPRTERAVFVASRSIVWWKRWNEPER